MDLPIRSKQHISESKSFRIFRNNVPDEWIIRDITERDYGIDCYLEIVGNDQRLTGELVSIQIKGINKINWNEDNQYKFGKIEISTTNYWYLFSVPVFICIVDLTTEEVFYLAVKKYIRENFDKYLNEKIFNYIFNKNQIFDKNNIQFPVFRYQYYIDQNYLILTNQITDFIVNYNEYYDYLENNIGRDFFLGVERLRIIRTKNIYNLIENLSALFHINWNLEKFENYKINSKNKYGDSYELYEEQLSEVAEKLLNKMKQLFIKIKTHICVTEETYWLCIDNTLANYVFNNTNDCKFIE